MRGRGARNCGWKGPWEDLHQGMRNREKEHKKKRISSGKGHKRGTVGRLGGEKKTGRSKELRWDKEEAKRRDEGGEVCQESLCNRSFLLFPEVAAEGEPSLGEVNLDSRWMGVE